MFLFFVRVIIRVLGLWSDSVCLSLFPGIVRVLCSCSLILFLVLVLWYVLFVIASVLALVVCYCSCSLLEFLLFGLSVARVLYSY